MPYDTGVMGSGQLATVLGAKNTRRLCPSPTASTFTDHGTSAGFGMYQYDCPFASYFVLAALYAGRSGFLLTGAEAKPAGEHQTMGRLRVPIVQLAL